MKVFIKAAMLSALLLLPLIVGAVDIGKLSYTLNSDKTAIVTGYVGGKDAASGELSIPDRIEYEDDEYAVTVIGKQAFYECSGLTGDLIIPESVTEIGAYSFCGCSGVSSITIPASLTKIGSLAFANCIGLKAVNISDMDAWWKIEFCSDYSNPLTWAGNLYLNGELVADIVIPESITTIPDYVFCGWNGSTTLTIPNTITSIGLRAFSGCTNLTGSLTIPESVTSIGRYAFSGCRGLTGSLTIPNSVTTIGYSAFSGCSGFTGVSITNSITKIEDRTFSGCSGFTGELTIPNSVTEIGERAFEDCSGFSGDLILSKNLVSIGENAFIDCDGFQNIVSLATAPPFIGNKVFSNGIFLDVPLHVADDAVANYRASSGWDKFVKITDMSGKDESVITIHRDDLLNYVINESNMTASVYGAIDVVNYFPNGLTIPEEVVFNSKRYRVTAILYRALAEKKLKGKLVLPETLEIIEDYAFYKNEITELNIPNSVIKIGNGAFEENFYITELVIGNSVEEIGAKAFHDLELNTIKIPRSIKSIGEYAFSLWPTDEPISVYISSLEDFCRINFKGLYASPLTFSSKLYIDGELVTELKIPDTITKINSYAFFAALSFDKVLIPNTVTEIGEGAFSGSYVKSITFPKSLKEVKDDAFSYCEYLENVIFQSPISKIGDRSFSRCPKLKEITIPAAVDSIGAYAFRGDTCLVKVNVESLEQWSNIVFENETANPLYYGAELVINGKKADVIEVPDVATEVKDFAFAGLKTIVEVIIPEVVEKIGTGSFEGCAGLENIKIPETVKSVGEKAFKACTGLAKAILGKVISPLSPSRATESAVEAATVEKLAFDSCTSLVDVVIGANVTMIADSAFTNCGKIARVDCYAMLAPELAASAFEAATQAGATLHVPAGYKDVYEASPVWGKFATIVDDLAVAELLALDAESVMIDENKTRQLALKSAVSGTVTWSSTNEAIATVTANGLVTGIKEGTARIIATAPNGARAFCTVTIVKPNAINGVEADTDGGVSVEGGCIVAPEGSAVYDMNGRRVATTNLPKGIYIVRTPAGRTVKARID